jgi:hypothetical protein
VPMLQVQLYLLKQTAAIEGAIYRRGEFIEESIHGGSARMVPTKGCKVGIHHPLGLMDNAGLVGTREADEAANCIVQVVHTRRSAARSYTVPVRAAPTHPPRVKPLRESNTGIAFTWQGGLSEPPRARARALFVVARQVTAFHPRLR